MAWLLHTNVLSKLRPPKPEQKVAGQPLHQLYVSAVTLAEIRFGIELVTEPSHRVSLDDWLRHKVRPMFDQPHYRCDGHSPRPYGRHARSSEYDKARAPVINPWDAP